MTDVVHLSSAHPPLDPRIHFRECRSLVEAGYSVTEIVPGLPSHTVEDGVHVRTVEPASGRAERMTRTVAAVYRACRSLKASLYHFHDPELIPVGLLLRLRGARVVYDVHEDLPRQTLDKDWLRLDVVRRIASGLVGPMEAGVGRMLDGIVVAAPEIARRFPGERTALVRNFVRLEMVDAAPPARRASRPVAVYPGSLTKVRGIRELVAAVGHLEGRVELWLMGSWGSPELKAACRAEPGWEHTRYLGWVPQGEVFGRLKAADVGLHMPHVLGSYASGLAMKGFEYMACGLPMVMTDEPAKRSTFGECALFADPWSPRSIADQVQRLVEDPDLASRLGRRGRALAEQQFSWEREAEELLLLYERILARR